MKLWQIALVLVIVGSLLAGILLWRESHTDWIGGDDFQKNHDQCHYESLKHSGFGRDYEELYRACMKLRGWERVYR